MIEQIQNTFFGTELVLLLLLEILKPFPKMFYQNVNLFKLLNNNRGKKKKKKN